MQELKRITQTVTKYLRSGFGRNRVIAADPRPAKTTDKNLVNATFAGHSLQLDRRWKHERNYLNYIEQSKITGPLGMDVWVFSHFVKPGHTVLDAGANIGFTALLAEKSGAKEIHCFEPDPRLIERLKSNCQGDKIVIHQQALSDKTDKMELVLSASHNQGSTLNDKMIDKFPSLFQGSEVAQVDVGTLDEIFGDQHFDFFKIDVEGAELPTLKGASALLQADPPETVYIELYDEFFPETHEFLKQYYPFAYRVVCDRNGSCQLVPVDRDVSQLEEEGMYVMPPSYIYSMSNQETLTDCWTPPAYDDEPA